LDKEEKEVLKRYVPKYKLFLDEEELQKVVAWVEHLRRQRQQSNHLNGEEIEDVRTPQESGG
jgi:hypothetical protein